MMKFKITETENIAVLGIFLAVLGLISAVTLGVVYHMTSKPIAQAKERRTFMMLKQLGLPEFDNSPMACAVKTTAPDGGEVIFMPAKKQGALVGLAAETSVNGYAGAVRFLAGIDRQGKILVVMVKEHRETPGLGEKVCSRKFKKSLTQLRNPHPDKLPENKILDQFSGRTLNDGPWLVEKDGGPFKYVTGATVTSRAAVKAVERILLAYRQNSGLLK